MSIQRIRRTVLAVTALAVANTACAQQADFNEVGRQMAIMLQNTHFAKLPYNAELSKRFLEDYLRDLDFNRVYFTQEDVSRFNEQYGDKLHTLLLQGDSLRAATDIYRTFEKRVETRVTLAKKILKEEPFEFTKNETVMRSRKDAPWPRNEAEANEQWRLQLKEAVLSETLRREMLVKMAKDQNKPDATKGEREPKEKISLRYERFLHSVKDADEEEIANYFLSAVSRAYDPHTEYMSFREMSRFKDGMRNELVGIGALLQAEEDGATKIMGLVVNGPADKEGSMKLNDRIVGVDSNNSGEMTDIMFMKIDKVVDLIRGKEGSSVRLKVEPAGGAAGETKLVVITREKVSLKDELASAELIEMNQPGGTKQRMGWITLPTFYADFEEGKTHCSVDVEKLLLRLNEEKIDGLILDLRNNGGGSLEEVRRMTGFFINRGPVVQVKTTLGQVQVQDADNRKPLYDGPLVVMIDKSSASASEILAGALQDYNRAVIVGDSSTFGKGTVQKPVDIGRMLPFFAARERAGSLKVTFQKFYRPSGSSTQLEGVSSDVTLPSLSDAVEIGEKFLDHALAHDRIRPASDFHALRKEDLFLPRLKELSQTRIKASKDFGYVTEDVNKAKTRLQENRVSLNIDERRKELLDVDTQQHQRNAERRERFKSVEAGDAKALKFFKLTLDDVEKGTGLREFDPSKENQEYMRRAKDATDALDDAPKWPTGLDPVKREGLMVLKDLVDLTESGRMADVTKKPEVR
jgi:carboxyl-terminal processing protease